MIKKLLVFVIILLFIGIGIASPTENFVEEISEYTINDKTVISEELLLRKQIGYDIYPYENNSGLFEWDLDNPKNFTFICFIDLISCVGMTWNPINCCILVINHTGELYEIDPQNCEKNYVGSTGIDELVSLSYNPRNGNLYSSSSNMFYEINMTTGKATSIGPFNTGTLMISIDCDSYGAMYGYDLNFGSNALWSIDLESGAATKIGNTGITPNYGLDMAYDFRESRMYACAFDYSSFLPELHTVNLETGEFTILWDDFILYCFCFPYHCNNQQPNAPIITGPTKGKVGLKYEYNFTLSDPELYPVHLRVDWGNGTAGQWQGPYKSGTTVELNHSWDEQGTFTIRAQAKDIYNAESEWGTFEVVITKNRNMQFFRFLKSFPFFQRVLNFMGWHK